MTRAELRRRFGGQTARAFHVRPQFLALGLIAVVALPFLVNPFRQAGFLGDFRGDLYAAGQAILRGENPYHDQFVAQQAAIKRAGGQPELQFAVPLFPAPMLIAATPISALPYEAAAISWFLLSALTLLLSLRILGVRDPRCVAVTFAWLPVLHALALGALEPILVFGAAAAWRWRDSVTAPAIAIASVVVAKLVLWPLGLWLLVTRRLRTFWTALAVGAVVTLGAWAVIGFSGMVEYPHLLSNLSFVEQADGVSLVAGLLAAGATPAVAHGIAFAAAGALLLTAWRIIRSPNGDRRALGLAVIAGLSASSIVWPQFLVLLIVPIALCSPSLSPMWFVPLLTWIGPVPRTHGRLLLILPYLAVEAIIVFRLLRQDEVVHAARGAATS